MSRTRTISVCLLFTLLASTGVRAAVGPGTTIERFNGSIGSWDRIDWVDGSLTSVTDTNEPFGLPDSIQYVSDPSGTQLQVNEVYYRGAVHLELDDVPTDELLRVDATLFQGVFSGGLAHWGVAVVLFFDENNFVSLNRVRDAGGGWMRFSKIAGTVSSVFNNLGQLDNQWIMQGIALTATNVQFFASPGGVDQFNSLDFENQMTEDLSAMNFARPASWTGTCTVVVGKGWDHAAGDPWDAISDLDTPKIIGFDTTRVIAGGDTGGLDLEVPSTNVVVDAAAVSFESTAGLTYRLESSPDLVSGSFADTGAAVIGDGTTMTLFDPIGAISTDYRVSVGQ